MLRVQVPDFEPLQLEHLVLDYNGTLALDGELLPGVKERLHRLASELIIHVVTGDTFGVAESRLVGIPCKLTILQALAQTQAKLAYVERLGAAGCVCIGNGRNDRAMLERAALGVAVIQREGTCVATLVAADVVAPSITDALDLLIRPQRLIATLRG